MVHILTKIADWIIEHEEKEAENCTIPDEIIDEWLENIDEHKAKLEEEGLKSSERYFMLLDLEKKVKHIKEIRQKRCKI